MKNSRPVNAKEIFERGFLAISHSVSVAKISSRSVQICWHKCLFNCSSTPLSIVKASGVNETRIRQLYDLLKN